MGHYYSPPPPIVSATGAQPYAGNKLPPQVTAVEVDNPPFVWQQIPTWGSRGGLPQTSPFTPQVPAVVRTVYAPKWLPSVLAWQLPDPSPTLSRNLNPSITAVPVNNPPFQLYGNIDWLGNVLQVWAPPDPPIQLPRYVPQVTVVVFKSPFSDAWLATVLTAWVPPDPLPTLPKNLNPQITAVEVDNPPFVWQQIPTWSLRGILPQASGRLSPGIPGQSVDNPPLLSLPVPVELGDYLPQQVQYKVTISGVAPVVKTAYAPQWLATVIQSWVPPDFLPTLARNLNPSITAVLVNNPPFTNFSRTAAFWTTIAAWEIPPPPQPQQTQPSYIVTILPPINLKTYSYISSSYIQ